MNLTSETSSSAANGSGVWRILPGSLHQRPGSSGGLWGWINPEAHVNRIEIVEVEFPDGGVGYAEIAVPAGGDVKFGTRRFRLGELGPDIRRVTRWLIDEINEALPNKPQKVGLEFGLKLSGKSGTLVSALAEVGAEATVVVKVEWNPDKGGAE